MKKLILLVVSLFLFSGCVLAQFTPSARGHTGSTGTTGVTGATGTGIVSSGTSKLITGFDTIKTASIASGSKVFLTGCQGSTGTMGILFENKARRSAGVYFVVYSSIAVDTTHYSWFITQ